jgi:oxygen-independent coproporphyrinogen-3 oxidase
MSALMDMDILNRYKFLVDMNISTLPRYTSYPTEKSLRNIENDGSFVSFLKKTGDQCDSISLYIHIPFCRHSCFYCGCNKVVTQNRKKIRGYLYDLVSEIERVSELLFFSKNKKMRVSQLHFGGGTPNYLTSTELTYLMYKISACFELDYSSESERSIELDLREMSAETIPLLSGLKFSRVSFGVQDLDVDVQKLVNRKTDEALLKEAVQQCREYGISSVSFDLIYGLPRQTPESFLKTLEKVIAMQPDRLSLFHYAHLPERFKSQRVFKEEELPSLDDKIHILIDAISCLKHNNYCYIGIDHFAKKNDTLSIAQKKGAMQRNFQGYSTLHSPVLIGLGASAISEFESAYFQNSISIIDYTDRISRGILPVQKAYFLSESDKIRRYIIMQLMCYGEIQMKAIENLFQLNFKDVFSVEMKKINDFILKGLVIFDGDFLQVTEVGRIFLRQIASVFDQYYSS